MSLFGSSPPEEPSQATRSGNSQSLFEDERAAAVNSSIFDDGDGNAPSPWEMPTPKKSAKGNPIKTLLPATDVPESYIDAFDVLLESGYGAGAASVTIAGARKLLEGSGVGANEQSRIIDMVNGGQELASGLGRSEFNVLLALVGLVQEHDKASLDGVDERRRSIR